MELNLRPPNEFLPCPGEPAVNFKIWIRSFENYLDAIDGSGFTDQRKKALLVHCLGQEGQRIFYTLPAPKDYKSCVKTLTQHFVPTVNVIAERHKFRQRSQQAGETVAHYTSDLRELASTCDFNDFENEMIRDQLIEKTCVNKIRERLLLEPNIDLNNAIKRAEQIESALSQSKTLTNDAKFANVSALTEQKPRFRKYAKAKPKGQPAEKKGAIETVCYRCGDKSHKANFKDCPAKAAECRLCKKIGHYGRMCRSTKEVREI